MKSIALMIAIAFSISAIADGAPKCVGGLKPAELKTFYQELNVNPAVKRFIGDNPGYTAAFPQYADPAEAYFNGRVASDYVNLVDHIPADPETSQLTVLDIGSGVGGINILLGRHYEKGIDVTLVDKTERQGISVIDEAVGLLQSNVEGITARGLEPGSPKVTDRKYDLILSLRGLGYMFPYSFYADAINQSLKLGGTLILDISKREEEGSDIIEGRFDGSSYGHYIQVIQEISFHIGPPIKIRDGADATRYMVIRTKP